MNEECTARQVNTTIQKKTYTNIGLLKHDIRVMAYWGFKKMHKLSSQCFKEVDMLLGSVCLWLSIDNAGREQAVCVLLKKTPVCLFHSNWQMCDVTEYPCAEMTEMRPMFGGAHGSEREARTRNTSHIVEFCTEKLFPPFIDGFGKMVHLTCSQGTVKRPRTILTPQS